MSAAYRPERMPPRFGTPFATEAIEKYGIVGYEASRRVAAEPIEWVWSGVIAKHHAVEVCGPSYSGKSTLAMLLLAACANPKGKPVSLLGREVTPMPPGRVVLYANEENGRQSAVASIDAAIEMLGLPLRETWDRICLLSRSGLRAYEAEGDELLNPEKGDLWAAVIHAATAGAFGLIALDTRARIFAGFGGPKDEDAQARVADEIVRLVEHGGAPVVVVSHTRKGSSDDIEDVSGSGQRGAAADTILMVSAERDDGRVTSSRCVFVKLRDGIGEHPAPISFSVAREDGRWRLAAGASAKTQDQALHERVYRVLESGGAKTKNELRTVLGCNAKRLEQAITTLFSEKRIRKHKDHVRGRARDTFSAVVDRDALFQELQPAGERKAADDAIF